MQIQDSLVQPVQEGTGSTKQSSRDNNIKCLTEIIKCQQKEDLKEMDHHHGLQVYPQRFKLRLQRSASNGSYFLNVQRVFENKRQYIIRHIDGQQVEPNQQQQQGNQEQSTQNVQQQQQQANKSKPKQIDASDEIFDLHIKEEKQDFENKYLNQLIGDSIQLEALCYQLATQGFMRFPITSNPAIIIYYVYCLMTCYKNSDFKQILKNITDYEDIDEMISRIGDGPFKSSLQQLLLSVKRTNTNQLDKLFNHHLTIMVNELSRSDQFNYQLAMDDFLKYRQIYQMNQAEIDLQQKEEVFKKFNLCISYIRFIFASPDDLSTFDIRIPLGEFQDKQLITFFDIQQLIKDNTKDRPFLEEIWYKDNLGFHSERVLLVWIIQNQQYLADQIYKQICARKYSYKNLQLLKVYLEITSERKVCNKCITMLKRFLTHYVSDDIIAILQKLLTNIIITVNDQFKLIFVSQFLYESQIQENMSANQNQRQNRFAFSQENQRKVIYIDTKYVGLLTDKYLNLRYMGLIKNSEITQQIDKVRLINSFFMSKEMDDDQEKSKKGSKDQSSTSSKRSLLNNAINVLQEKMQILRNAANTPIKIQQIAKQYIKDSYLEQIRIQQCYSLIWIMIESINEVLTEANLIFLSRSMFYCLKLTGDFPNIHFAFLQQKIKILNKGYLPNFLKCVQNTILIKNIFTSSNLNVEMLLRDYLFLQMKNVNNQIFDILDITLNELQTSYNQQYSYNLGLIEAIFTAQQNDGEELRTNIKFESIYMKDIVNKQSGEVNKLEKIGLKVINVQYFICSSEQLTNEYKQYFQYQLQKQSNNIPIEFYYMFFRQLQPEQEIENNERQFIIYDSQQFITRYHQINHDSQVSFTAMNSQTLDLRLYFTQDEIGRSHKVQIEQHQQ